MCTVPAPATHPLDAAEAARQAQRTPAPTPRFQRFKWYGTALLLVGTHLFAFICGRAATTTGSAHLDAVASYLNLAIFQRTAAMDIQMWTNMAGMPLHIAQPGEATQLFTCMCACYLAWRSYGRRD